MCIRDRVYVLSNVVKKYSEWNIWNELVNKIVYRIRRKTFKAVSTVLAALVHFATHANQSNFLQIRQYLGNEKEDFIETESKTKFGIFSKFHLLTPYLS